MFQRVSIIALCVLAHAALAGWLFMMHGSLREPETKRLLAITWVQPLALPPSPTEQLQPQARELSRRQPIVVPALPAAIPPPIPPAPVAHVFTEDQAWVMPEVDAPVRNGDARRAPSAYAEVIKAKVVANLVFPPDALYPAPKNFKGDPQLLKRRCVIPYEVVVDRSGKMISFKIERCGDDLLDAAAEAALRNAGTFPPPPNGDAEQYIIYGTANFR